MKKNLKLKKIKRNQVTITEPPSTINQNTLAQTIVQYNGMITLVAHAMNSTPKIIKKLIKKTPYLDELMTIQKDTSLDIAESALMTKVKEGNLNAIKFFLETQGNSRGYSKTQKIQVKHKGGICLIPQLPEEKWEQIVNDNKHLANENNLKNDE